MLRKKLSLIYDDYYAMMSDEVRLNSFRRAIFDTVGEGDVVVDLGAGLGILAFFAVQAGAERVYAIEKLDVSLAQKLAQKNRLDNIIFIRGNSTEVELPEKADVMISETLGSFAIDENTLEFIIDSRRRFLKKKGKVIPRKLKLWLTPVEASKPYEKMAFWNDMLTKYGVDFSPAVGEVLSKLIVEDIKNKEFMAEPKVFKNLDLRKIKEPVVESSLTFNFSRSGIFHGFAGWFQANLSRGVSVNTGPNAERTHWKQAFFPLKQPLKVRADDEVVITMKVSPKSPGEGDTIISYDCLCTQS